MANAEKLAPVDGLFDSHKYSRDASSSVLNFKKGIVYGTELGIATSLARAAQLERAAVPRPLHISPEKVWSRFMGYARTGVPAIAGTMTGFFVVRGMMEESYPSLNLTLGGLLAPLATVSLPAVAIAAVKRAPPPEAMALGICYSALFHGYDRMMGVRHYGGFVGKTK